MRKIIFASAILLFFSCGKKDPGVTKNQNNHMQATVTFFSSGNTVTLNETGQNVTFGNYLLLGQYVTVVNAQKQQVTLDITDYDSNGIFEGSVVYYPDNTLSGQEYRSYTVSGDTVYFTNINGNHKEGNFVYTCIKTPTDTVRVSGSFNGDFPE